MKVFKTGWRTVDIMVPKRRTFWEWLTRKRIQIVPSGKTNQVPFKNEFDCIQDLLIYVLDTTQRGQSVGLCGLKGNPNVWFSVDRGRNKLAIQASGINEEDAKFKLDTLISLFDNEKLEVELDGKIYKVVFNIVNVQAHRLLNCTRNSGG